MDSTLQEKYLVKRYHVLSYLLQLLPLLMPCRFSTSNRDERFVKLFEKWDVSQELPGTQFTPFLP